MLRRLHRAIYKVVHVDKNERWALIWAYTRSVLYGFMVLPIRVAIFNRFLLPICVRMLKRRIEFFGTSHTIGDMVTECEYYLKRKLLLKSKVISVYLINKPHIANLYLARFQKRALSNSRTIFVMNRFLCLLLEPLERELFFAGPKAGFTQHPAEYHKFNQQYNFHLERQLPGGERTRARKLMQEAGLPSGAKFVCVYAREAGFKARTHPDGHNTFRDIDISTYIPAIEYLTEQGFWVVRMGEATVKPLPRISKVVDYACGPFKCDFLDIVLIAECEFFLGCNSGLSLVAHVFNKPALWTNSVPLDICPWNEFSLWIPKLIFSKSKGGYLTFPEVVKFGVGKFHRTQNYESANLEVHGNSPEDILEATKELYQYYQKGLAYLEDCPEGVRIIQKSFNRLFPRDYRSHGTSARICTSFIMRHGELMLEGFQREQVPISA